MYRIISAGLDAALAAILLIPVFLILNCIFFHSFRKSLLYYIFSVYLCGVYAVVGLPSLLDLTLDFNINLAPFLYMFSDLDQTILNVLLFIPLGFFLPVFWRCFRKFSRTLFFGFCFSLLIELLQIFTFRATDINDLMTNTLGTVLGWVLGVFLLKRFPSILPSSQTKSLDIIFAVSFLLMFFVFPFAYNAVFELVYPLFRP